MTRQVERAGRTKGAARAALTSYLTERVAPAADTITGESLLREVGSLWLAERAKDGLATNTVRRYREVLEAYIGPGVGSLRIREATVTHLDRFIKSTAATTGAPTAKLCVSVLTGVMGMAVRHGAAGTNPMRDVAPVRVDSKEVRALTLDEVGRVRAAVLAYVESRPIAGEKVRRGGIRALDLADIVDVMLGTGTRIGEVLALRWQDVDLETGAVTICGTIISSDTKPARQIRQPFPKGKRPRTLLLPGFAVEALLRRRVHLTAANTGDLVFPSANGTCRDPGNVRKTLNRILEMIGLDWVTPHVFRKTVATFIDADSDAKTAADQLGNTEKVARKHYIAQPATGPDARATLGRLVPGASNGATQPNP